MSVAELRKTNSNFHGNRPKNFPKWNIEAAYWCCFLTVVFLRYYNLLPHFIWQWCAEYQWENLHTAASCSFFVWNVPHISTSDGGRDLLWIPSCDWLVVSITGHFVFCRCIKLAGSRQWIGSAWGFPVGRWEIHTAHPTLSLSLTLQKTQTHRLMFSSLWVTARNCCFSYSWKHNHQAQFHCVVTLFTLMLHSEKMWKKWNQKIKKLHTYSCIILINKYNKYRIKM